MVIIKLSHTQNIHKQVTAVEEDFVNTIVISHRGNTHYEGQLTGSFYHHEKLRLLYSVYTNGYEDTNSPFLEDGRGYFDVRTWVTLFTSLKNDKTPFTPLSSDERLRRYQLTFSKGWRTR